MSISHRSPEHQFYVCQFSRESHSEMLSFQSKCLPKCVYFLMHWRAIKITFTVVDTEEGWEAVKYIHSLSLTRVFDSKTSIVNTASSQFTSALVRIKIKWHSRLTTIDRQRCTHITSTDNGEAVATADKKLKQSREKVRMSVHVNVLIDFMSEPSTDNNLSTVRQWRSRRHRHRWEINQN